MGQKHPHRRQFILRGKKPGCSTVPAAMTYVTEGVWILRTRCLLGKPVPHSALRFIPPSIKEERLQVKTEPAFSKNSASHKGPGHTGPRNRSRRGVSTPSQYWPWTAMTAWGPRAATSRAGLVQMWSSFDGPRKEPNIHSLKSFKENVSITDQAHTDESITLWECSGRKLQLLERERGP